MPFLAICRSQFPFWYTWYQKAIIALWKTLRKKKKINYYFKGLHKTNYYNTKFNFSQFFFSQWLLYEKFRKKDFIYKNGENLKKLVEIFCQKLIVSNVTSAFSDHLKPKTFFPFPTTVADIKHPPFKNLWIRTWKMSVFGVILVRIFPHADGIRRDTERYSVSLRIQSKCGKIRTRIIPNMDTFYAVNVYN